MYDRAFLRNTCSKNCGDDLGWLSWRIDVTRHRSVAEGSVDAGVLIATEMV
jgi:hypothetical protein